MASVVWQGKYRKMKAILLTNTYYGRTLEIVQEELPEEFELCFLQKQTREALLMNIHQTDYLLAGGRLKITREVLELADNLKMIQRSGVGLDALDLEAIKEKRIPLYVNQGVNAESVAEHTLLLILACLRRLPQIARNTKNGIWKKQEQGIQTSELYGKTVGIIGMGHAARTLVELLRPFHVKILYYNRSKADFEFEQNNGLEFAELKELLQSSDVLTLHCALAEQTQNLIRSETLEMMKPGSILVNTARGGLVDTKALADALKSGHLAYAAMDVHETEPFPEDYPLRKLDNVILTPHIAGITEDSFRTMMRQAFRNIECFDQGRLDEIAQSRYL